MIRKGPDGKTIRPSEIPAAPDAPTQKVPRRSIKDRLMAQNDPDEVPATHLAGPPATTLPKGAAAPPPPDPDMATVYATDTPGRPKAPALDAPTGPRATAMPAAPPPIPPAPPPQTVAPPPLPAAAAETPTGEPPPTQIYRPANKPEPPGPSPIAAKTKSPSGPPVVLAGDGTVQDPVVGWLVIVEGPGRGTSLSLGYGNNRIGRAPTENVSLDFGDEQISRENHATVTFDGRHRRFYVQQGGGRNLVYVNDEPVMVPIELKGGEEVMLGQTKLKFVPFCGKNFDWYAK